MIIGTDGKVSVSSDGGKTWVDLGQNVSFEMAFSEFAEAAGSAASALRDVADAVNNFYPVQAARAELKFKVRLSKRQMLRFGLTLPLRDRTRRRAHRKSLKKRGLL